MQPRFSDRFLRFNSEVMSLCNSLSVQTEDEVLDEICRIDKISGFKHQSPQNMITRTYRKKNVVVDVKFCPECDVSIAEEKERLSKIKEENTKRLKEKREEENMTLSKLRAK